MTETKELFEEVAKLVKVLQEKCPLAKCNTFDSLKKSLAEEAIEVQTAIDKKDWENLKEELGDALWDWIAICWLAKQKGLFKTSEVLENLKEKIKRRNPHVFGNAKADTKEEVKELKQRVKQKEKKERGKK